MHCVRRFHLASRNVPVESVKPALFGAFAREKPGGANPEEGLAKSRTGTLPLAEREGFEPSVEL